MDLQVALSLLLLAGPPTLPAVDRANATGHEDDCGLAAYPADRPSQEIVAEAPPSKERSSSLRAKVQTGKDGRVTHIRVLRLAFPREGARAQTISHRAVDALKEWRFTPPAGAKPEPRCFELAMTVDIR